MAFRFENNLYVYGEKQEIIKFDERFKQPCVGYKPIELASEDEKVKFEKEYEGQDYLCESRKREIYMYVPFNRSDEYSFENFVSRPSRGTIDFGGWNIDNWGSSENIYEMKVFIHEQIDKDLLGKTIRTDAYRYVFQTRFDAPKHAIEAISSEFPNLIFCLESQCENHDTIVKRIYSNGELKKKESFILQNLNKLNA